MAWIKKSDSEENLYPNQSYAAPTPTSSGSAHSRESSHMNKLVNIGKSVKIKGELIGEEDLVIEGRVNGKITLKDHTLTIGENGHIKAEIEAKNVIVTGEMVGNIKADHKVEISATGSMHGDISAPRVVLADGARFKGGVDMGTAAKEAVVAAKAQTVQVDNDKNKKNVQRTREMQQAATMTEL